MHRRQWLALTLTAGLVACGGARRTPPDAQPETTVEVDNQGFLDMTIYLIAGSARIRLGIAGGARVTTLRIPPQYVFGVSSLQFLADPIGGRRAPVSDTINVSPGDRLRLVIPPNA